MGQYIVTGLTTDIKILNNSKQKLDYEQIHQCVLKYYHLEMFIEAHTEQYFCWKVKDDIFKEGLVEFLSEYLNVYGANSEKLVETIRSCQNFDEIFILAETKEFENFQLDLYGESDYVKLPFPMNNIEIMHKEILLTLDGKIMTEGITRFLHLATHCLRQTFSKYPLGLLLKAYITG